MLLRRLMIVFLSFLALVAIGLFGIRYTITRSITCLPECVGINLMARNLQGQDLHGSKLIEAQLQNTNLSGANLREADLSGANLLRANLRNADLTDARMIGADLSGARLEGSILQGADLSGANLSGADLTNVDLRNTLLGGANFAEAKLTNAQLQGANLSGLNFSKASLAGANLSKANLAGSTLSQADLSGAMLVQTDLTGAWLNLTNLVGTNFTAADLSGSSLLGAKMASVNLQNSKVVGAILVGAQLDGANVRSADMQDARILPSQLPARLQSFLQDARAMQSLYPDQVRSIDPVLQELNDSQRKGLLVATDLNGVAFDSQTIWPIAGQMTDQQQADQQSLGESIQDQSLLTPTSGTVTTTNSTVGETSSDLASSDLASSDLASSDLASSDLTDINGLPIARRLAVNFFINSIRNIRDQTSEYTGDFYIDIFWNEPSLAKDQDVNALDPAKLWNPQLAMINSLNGQFLYEVYDNSIEPDTNIRLSYRAIGDFVGNFDLYKFPFDQQRVVIELEPKNSNSDTAVLEFIDSTAAFQTTDSNLGSNVVRTLDYSEETAAQSQAPSEQPYIQKIPKGRYVDAQAVGSEWRIEDAQVSQRLYFYPHDQSSRSRFQIELTLARQPAPYVWKYMLPLVMLALLVWSVCLIDAKRLAFRLWLLVILLISLVAFHSSMRRLPQMTYTTYLDRFLLLHYAMLIWMVAWLFFYKVLRQRGYLRLARWMNRGLVVGYPIAYIALNLLLYWY